MNDRLQTLAADPSQDIRRPVYGRINSLSNETSSPPPYRAARTTGQPQQQRSTNEDGVAVGDGGRWLEFRTHAAIAERIRALPAVVARVVIVEVVGCRCHRGGRRRRGGWLSHVPGQNTFADAYLTSEATVPPCANGAAFVVVACMAENAAHGAR